MTLYVFALNTPVSVTLTDLSRARGEAVGLPPLAAWLGLEALDTDRVEMFPIDDLGELPLSSYLATAHDADPTGQSARLDALEGSVLLVPERAVTGTPAPGPEATLVATLPTAAADHQARLAPAAIPDTEQKPEPADPAMPARPLGWIIAVALALAALILWVVT